jgi:basic membrane protein A and related proteins
MKAFFKTALAAATLLGLFAGSAQAAPAPKVRVALIVESTVDDKGWCQSMHDAILAVQKKMGAGAMEYSHSEKMKPVDAGSAARQYASKGFDIIICHGAQYKNLVDEMAGVFPNTTFAYGTSANIGAKNVFTYTPFSEETGYLNGIIAGMVTKTGKIGNVGPVDGGDAARYIRGFQLGVQAANPKAAIRLAFTGSFGDFVKAGELAQTQLKDGADVLTGAAQQAIGALRAVAAAPAGIWWVGQDTAQLSIPEGSRVLAASGYNYASVVENLIAKRAAGTKGGESLPMQFSNGGFHFEYNAKADAKVLTPAVKKAVDKAREDLKSGKLKLDWKAVKL